MLSHAVTLTFYFLVVNFKGTSVVMRLNSAQNLSEIEQSTAEYIDDLARFGVQLSQLGKNCQSFLVGAWT